MADKDQAQTETEQEEEGATFAEAFAERAADPFGAEAQKAADEAATNDEPADEAGKVEAPSNEGAMDTSGFNPWQGLSPEQEAHFRKIEASDRSNRGRVGALTKKVNNLLAGTSGAAPKGEEEGDQTASTDKQLEDMDARLAKVAEDYGDVNGPVVEAVKALRKEVADLKGDKVKSEIDADAEVMAKEYEALEQEHPDFRNYHAGNAEFVAWFQQQPDEVRVLGQSNSASDVADLISRFKEANRSSSSGAAEDGDGGGNGGKASEDVKRQRQLEGSRQAISRGAPTATGVPNDFGAAFRARSRQIEEERQQPR